MKNFLMADLINSDMEAWFIEVENITDKAELYLKSIIN